MKKHLIAIILAFTTLLSICSISFAAEIQTATISVNTDFNALTGGSAPATIDSVWDVIVNGNSIDVSAGLDNEGKCLVFKPTYGSSGGPYIQTTAAKLDGNFILEGRFTFKKHSGCTPKLFLLSNSSSETASMIEIDGSGNVLEVNGNVLGKITEGVFTKFDIVVFPETKTYDVYMNNRRIRTGIKINMTSAVDFGRWRIQAADIKEGCTTELYIDDLAVYQTNNNVPVFDGSLSEAAAKSTEDNLYDGFLYVIGTPRMLRRGYVVKFAEGQELRPLEINEKPYIPLRYSTGMFDNSSVVWKNEDGGYAVASIGDNTIEARQGVNAYMADGNMLIDAYEFAKFADKNVWYDKKNGLVFLSGRDTPPDWFYNKELLDKEIRRVIYDNPNVENIKNDFSANILKEQHPRVIINQEELNEILQAVKSNEKMAKYAKDIMLKAKAYAASVVTEYQIPDGLRLYAACDTARNRIMYMSMAYLLSEDVENKELYAEKVWEEVENVCVKWTDWNPYHFLDTGLMTMGVAVAYDWLYDYWTPERRAVMEKAIYNRGVQPILDDLLDRPRERKNFWLDLENNWTLLCVGGVGNGALAIADVDEYSNDCALMLEQGLMQLQRSLQNYGPDGGYIEGTSYWGMASEYFARLVDSLQNCCGTDYGLMRAPGLRQTGYFPLAMMGPGGTFNFSDSDTSTGVSSAVLFFSKQFKDAGLQEAYSNVEFSNNLTGTVDSLIWYDPTLEGSSANAETTNYYRYLETITMRNSWLGEGANFIGFHVGDNNASHAHLDMGSFILDMNGKRFALDLGKGNYNDPGGDFRYRYSAEGHNTWVINPDNTKTQSSKAFCPVDKYDSNQYEGYAISDISKAYSGKINSIVRGVYATEKKKIFVVQDELDNGNLPFEAYWQMHTKADIEILDGGKQAILTIDDDCVLVSLLTDNDAVFEVMECKPYPKTPVYKSSISDEDKKKLVLHFQGATKETVAVEFQHFYKGETPPQNHVPVNPLDEWKLGEIKEEWMLSPPTVTSVMVNGIPIENFSEKTKNYSIDVISTEIDTMEITATADENSNVSIEYPDSYPGTVRIIATRDMLRETYSVRVIPQYDISQFTDAEQLRIISVEATAEPQPENSKENAIDGDYSTRWSASGWNSITFDLGSDKRVDYISLAYYNGASRKNYFEIETSEDGAVWTKQIKEGETGLTDGDQFYPIVADNVRFIRVNCRGTSDSSTGWNSITEFKAFGK